MPALSILVIDDDSGDRKLVRRLVSAFSANAFIAEVASVEQADQLAATNFDGVFLDNMLPGRTGLECLSVLRTMWPRAAIFLMTSQGDEVVAKSAIQNGATDYISKSALSLNSVERMLRNGTRAALDAWRLEEQRRDLTIFSEMLIHDFRAPIRAAIYLSAQIETDLEQGDIEEARAGLRLLQKSSQQMMDMIAGLADHVRLDRVATRESVPPADLIDRALTALAEDIAHSGARVDCETDPALACLTCNPPQIAQVLQNLIANAIKYAGEGRPEIRVSVRQQDGDQVLFEVADAGIGVPEKYRDRIFEPFKRVPGTGNTEGTGLGLATCRKVVTRHGGRIWCDSPDGGGTAIRFLLPRNGSDAGL